MTDALMVEPSPLIVAVYTLGAYLLGAVPTGYLVSRYAAGIDIRDYGSGNVGASNVMEHVGKRLGLAQGIFDCLVKGTAPILIGYPLGMELWTQGLAGFAAVAGHNWSPFLKFTGGRGVATALGAALGLGMWIEIPVFTIASFTVGRLIARDIGLWTLISLLGLPVATYLLDRPNEVTLTVVCIGLLIALKRLTANWEPPPPEYPIHKVLMYRILWDRDVPKQAEWTDRSPRAES